MRRRVIREKAMQALFQIDVGGIETEKAINYMFGDAKPAKFDWGFAQSLVFGTMKHISDIDSIIVKNTPGWDIKRMANVERSILRMAVYEMLHENKVPFSVIINEAIELAKVFGSKESGAFVNGVLDQIGKTIRHEN